MKTARGVGVTRWWQTTHSSLLQWAYNDALLPPLDLLMKEYCSRFTVLFSPLPHKHVYENTHPKLREKKCAMKDGRVGNPVYTQRKKKKKKKITFYPSPGTMLLVTFTRWMMHHVQLGEYSNMGNNRVSYGNLIQSEEPRDQPRLFLLYYDKI